MSERIQTVTMDIVEKVRDVLRAHEVTFAEYRAGFMHLVKTQEAGEIPLMLDMFFNGTIVDIENQTRKGSQATIQGPYFVADAPHVDGQLAIRDEDMKESRMVMRGKVTDLNGKPLAGTVIDVWHSTPDGLYSGIQRLGGIDKKYYRGKITTDADGNYECYSILPVPYQIPNGGPTGKLLEVYLERHSWRPAHIHYWVQAENMRDLITQAYFEGDQYIEDDSCAGGSDAAPDFMVPEAFEGDVRVMKVDFKLEPALANLQAAE